jgi:F-type H+-transporting ATPase subunit a
VLGLFTKPFALAVRLFANMTAGHVILLSLIGLTFVAGAFIPVMIGFSLFINVLELLVAFIQAYIFTMLTSVFVGIATAGHDDHGHDEAHAAAH